MDLGNVPQVEVKEKAKSTEIASLKKPSINPPTTAKMTTAMEKNRKKLEMQRKKEEQKIKEDEDRKKKQKAVKFSIFYKLIVGA